MAVSLSRDGAGAIRAPDRLAAPDMLPGVEIAHIASALGEVAGMPGLRFAAAVAHPTGATAAADGAHKVTRQ